MSPQSDISNKIGLPLPGLLVFPIFPAYQPHPYASLFHLDHHFKEPSSRRPLQSIHPIPLGILPVRAFQAPSHVGNVRPHNPPGRHYAAAQGGPEGDEAAAS